MKNGTANSTKLSMPRAVCWAKNSPGSMSPPQTYTRVVSASTNAIGNPATRLTTNTMPIAMGMAGSRSGA